MMFSPYEVKLGDSYEYIDVRSIIHFRISDRNNTIVFWFRCCDPVIIRACTDYEFEQMIARLWRSWQYLVADQEGV